MSKLPYSRNDWKRGKKENQSYNREATRSDNFFGEDDKFMEHSADLEILNHRESTSKFMRQMEPRLTSESLEEEIEKPEILMTKEEGVPSNKKLDQTESENGMSLEEVLAIFPKTENNNRDEYGEFGIKGLKNQKRENVRKLGIQILNGGQWHPFHTENILKEIEKFGLVKTNNRANNEISCTPWQIEIRSDSHDYSTYSLTKGDVQGNIPDKYSKIILEDLNQSYECYEIFEEPTILHNCSDEFLFEEQEQEMNLNVEKKSVVLDPTRDFSLLRSLLSNKERELNEAAQENSNLYQELKSKYIQSAIKTYRDRILSLEICVADHKELLTNSMVGMDEMRNKMDMLRTELDCFIEKTVPLETFPDEEFDRLMKQYKERMEKSFSEHEEKMEEMDLLRQRHAETMSWNTSELYDAYDEHFISENVDNIKPVVQITDEDSVNALLNSQITESTTEYIFRSESSAVSLTENNQFLKEAVQKFESMLELEKSNKSQNIHLYKSTIAYLIKKLSDALEEGNESHKKQNDLSEQVEKFLAEKSETEKQVNELTDFSECIVTAQMKLEVEELCQLFEYSSKLTDLQESLKRSESSKRMLQLKLLGKNKQNENISRQLRDEIKKLEILETEFEELRLEKQQMTETIEDLKKRFHDLKKFNQDNIKKRDDMAKTVDRLSKEAIEKDKRIKSMEESLKKTTMESDTKISELSKKVSYLEKEYNSKIQENRRQDAIQSDEIKRLKREIADSEEELKKTKNQSALQLKTFQGQLDLLSNDVTSHRHLISKLENSKRHLEAQMNEVESMLGYLKKESKRQMFDNLRLRQDVYLYEAEKADLLVEVDNFKQRAKAAENVKNHLEFDFKEKLREILKALGKSLKSEQNLSQLNRAAEKENREYRNRMLELEHMFTDFERVNSSFRSYIDYLGKENAKRETILKLIDIR